MKKGKYKVMKELGYYSSLGLNVSFCIFIGLFFGIYLDKKFDMVPVWTLIFLGFGIVAGFRSLVKAAKNVKNIKDF